jgi:chromosome segregation ATPase
MIIPTIDDLLRDNQRIASRIDELQLALAATEKQKQKLSERAEKAETDLAVLRDELNKTAILIQKIKASAPILVDALCNLNT